MNAIGTNDDLRVLMHEGGHAFHALACAEEPLWAYRQAPIEFCEVASMSMELLAAAHLSVCYDEAQRHRWWREHLEGIIRTLTSVAVNDAFQHWLYENPSHSREQRNAQWVALNRQYEGGMVDWEGLEEYRALMWQRILHFYQVPFYYIEYGIAQLGATGIWLRFGQDAPKAIQTYKTALSLGGSRPLPDLFAAAGLSFDFSPKTIRPLAKAICDRWAEYCHP
jgi:oligoendopeptidase F